MTPLKPTARLLPLVPWLGPSNRLPVRAPRASLPLALLSLLAPVLFTVAGCMPAMVAPPSDSKPVSAAQTQRERAQAEGAQQSALSYGTVTSQVKKNKTTQLELIQLFGGPSISSTDADGTEVWVYERSYTETDMQTRSDGYRAAANLDAFFSHVNLGVSGGVAKSAGAVSSASSFRSLTVIVKFNANKTVKDFSVRASQF